MRYLYLSAGAQDNRDLIQSNFIYKHTFKNNNCRSKCCTIKNSVCACVWGQCLQHVYQLFIVHRSGVSCY